MRWGGIEITLSAEELAAAMERQAAEGVTEIVRKAEEEMLRAMRAEIAGAFRSGRMPYVVTSMSFPSQGASLDATAYLFARGDWAEMVLEAFSTGATIAGREGAWLAIPTKAVPRTSSGRRMTPVEVEAMFNLELQHRPARGGRAAFLVLDLMRSRNGRGYRVATDRRRAQGRVSEPVVMFILVSTATLPKRLSPETTVGAAIDKAFAGS